MASHNQVVAIRARTLAHVLLEIAEADRDCKRHWNEDDEGECLDHLEALRNEARAMVEAETGVSWDQLSEANL